MLLVEILLGRRRFFLGLFGVGESPKQSKTEKAGASTRNRKQLQKPCLKVRATYGTLTSNLSPMRPRIGYQNTRWYRRSKYLIHLVASPERRAKPVLAVACCISQIAKVDPMDLASITTSNDDSVTSHTDKSARNPALSSGPQKPKA